MTTFEPVVLEVDLLFDSQVTILRKIREAGVDQTGVRCSMFLAYRLFGTVEQCCNTATVRVTGVCVHEHGRVWHACERCATGAMAGPQFCNDCSLSSEPHECEIRVTSGTHPGCQYRLDGGAPGRVGS